MLPGVLERRSFGCERHDTTDLFAALDIATGCSAEIQRRCLDRGVFCSIEELTTALQEWIKPWNDSALRTGRTAVDTPRERSARTHARAATPGHHRAAPAERWALNRSARGQLPWWTLIAPRGPSSAGEPRAVPAPVRLFPGSTRADGRCPGRRPRSWG